MQDAAETAEHLSQNSSSEHQKIKSQQSTCDNRLNHKHHLVSKIQGICPGRNLTQTIYFCFQSKSSIAVQRK